LSIDAVATIVERLKWNEAAVVSDLLVTKKTERLSSKPKKVIYFFTFVDRRCRSKHVTKISDLKIKVCKFFQTYLTEYPTERKVEEASAKLACDKLNLANQNVTTSPALRG